VTMPTRIRLTLSAYGEQGQDNYYVMSEQFLEDENIEDHLTEAFEGMLDTLYQYLISRSETGDSRDAATQTA